MAIADQYISLLGAARKINATDAEVKMLAEQAKIRTFVGSLGTQMLLTDFEQKILKDADAKLAALRAKTGGKPPPPPSATTSGKITPVKIGGSGKTAPVAAGAAAPGDLLGSVIDDSELGPADKGDPAKAKPGAAAKDADDEGLFESSDMLLDAGGNLSGTDDASATGDLDFRAAGRAALKKPETPPSAAPSPSPAPASGPATASAPPTGSGAVARSTAMIDPLSKVALPPVVEPLTKTRVIAPPTEELPVAVPDESTAALPRLPAGVEPVGLGKTHHLMLDDSLIESAENLTRLWHQPEKHPSNPVLLPDRPWEAGGYAVVCGSVLHDAEENAFKIWYHSLNQLGRGVGYAVSQDGANWKKPELNVAPWKGKPTNLVLSQSGPTRGYAELLGVVRDPNIPAGTQGAFKAVFAHIDPDKKKERNAHGLKTALSPDGVQWTADDKVTLPGLPGVGHLMRDEQTGAFVLFAKGKSEGRRVVVRLDSKDFVNWSAPVPVLGPDDADPEGTDIHSLAVHNYGRLYIGLAQVYHGPPDCLVDIQIAFSHDGKTWHRSDRSPFIPLGKEGEWDRFHHSVAVGKTIRVARRELWFFYGGRTYRHPTYEGPDKGTTWGGVGLAKLRVDGFASMGASFREGVLVTKPLTLKYPNIYVNAYNRFGEFRCTVLDVEGRPLPGLTSQPFVGDKMEMPLQWSDPKALTPLLRKPVRLKFTLRNSRLYSVWTQ